MNLKGYFCEILWNYWQFISRVPHALIALKWDGQERNTIVIKFMGSVCIWDPDSDCASSHILVFLTAPLWPLTFTYFIPFHPSYLDSRISSVRNTSLISHSRIRRVYNLKFGIWILLIKVYILHSLSQDCKCEESSHWAVLFTIVSPEPKSMLNKYGLNEGKNELKNESESWIHYF